LSERSLREGENNLKIILEQHPNLLINLPLLLIGNKIDIESGRGVKREDALLFAIKYKCLDIINALQKQVEMLKKCSWLYPEKSCKNNDIKIAKIYLTTNSIKS